MAKKISIGKSAMDKAMIGLNKVAIPVIQSMGPHGLNSFIKGNIPRITNDGFTIAVSLDTLKDQQEDCGAYVIRNVCSQQNDDVGDGTTTVAVLTKSIIEESLKRPEHPNFIKESLKKEGNKILKTLSKKSIKITKKDVKQVALISAENEELANIITEIVDKLGDKVEIDIEDSRTFSTSYDIVDGYTAHVGFMSPAFITDKKTAKAVYSDIPVICSQKKISNLADISNIFNMFAFETNKEGKLLTAPDGKPIPSKNPITSCVFVCEDIDDSMLGLLVKNFEMKVFNALVIRATSLLLEDIAGYTGATIISNETGVNFQNFNRSNLGFAKKIVATANKTQITGDGVSHKQYIKNLQAKADGEPNMYTEKNMRQRISNLKGEKATLKIGGAVDFEREYLRYKAEDTVKAVQSALEEGIVEGGGMTLWRIAQDIKPKTVGEEILKKALTSPLRQIIENCGKDYAEILINMPEGMGYDAKNDEYVDMIKVGIIDPSKVERCALENAISTSAEFITTGNFNTEEEDDKKS